MKKFFLVLLAFACCFAIAVPVHAYSFSVELGTEFSGAYEPEGPAPWLEATFDDGDTPGTVTLKLEATNLTGFEFVSWWGFNLDPDLDPIDVWFPTQVSGEAWTSMGVGADAFKADGDGFFDFYIGWDNGDFTSGEEAVFEFSYAGLTAADFDYLSAPGGGNGSWVSAAHVQGIGEAAANSGWIGGDTGTYPPVIPEPATIFLVCSGLVGLAGFRRKRLINK